MTTAVATTSSKTRVIFQCKRNACKHVWAYEYKTFAFNGELFRWIENGLGGKERQFYKSDLNGRCPQCAGCFIEGNMVEGTVTGHVCDARCMGAKNGACECSCGGANHGISHL